MAANYAIDASSIINLNNVGALRLACKLARCKFWLSPIVVSECEPSCAANVLALQASGAIGFIDDTLVPTDLFLDLLAKHELGEGETESIAVSKALGYNLCCDDRKARALAKTILNGSIIGSVRVLRWCVDENLILCKEAFELFGGMRNAGGFLPQTSHAYFCEEKSTC